LAQAGETLIVYVDDLDRRVLVRSRIEALEDIKKQIAHLGDRAGLHRVEENDDRSDVQAGQGGKEQLAIDASLGRFARQLRVSRFDRLVDLPPPTALVPDRKVPDCSFRFQRHGRSANFIATGGEIATSV
jgi:hypothetical protein